MKQYQVVLSKTAEKELSKLSAQVVNKIVPVLASIPIFHVGLSTTETTVRRVP